MIADCTADLLYKGQIYLTNQIYLTYIAIYLTTLLSYMIYNKKYIYMIYNKKYI